MSMTDVHEEHARLRKAGAIERALLASFSLEEALTLVDRALGDAPTRDTIAALAGVRPPSDETLALVRVLVADSVDRRTRADAMLARRLAR